MKSLWPYAEQGAPSEAAIIFDDAMIGMIGAGLLSVSLLAAFLIWRRQRGRAPKAMEWSDNSPKPPPSHNLER
jgi:hypothetical protein